MVGRLIRAQMRDEAAETPARAAERVRSRKAAEQAYEEALTKFKAVTPENARDFISWREARIKTLLSTPVDF